MSDFALVGFTANSHPEASQTAIGPAIWTHTIRGETSAASWIYALQPDFTYDQLLKQGLRDAITSLAAPARTLK